MLQFVKKQPAIWVFAAALVLVVFTAIGADKVSVSYRRSAEVVTHTREVELHISRARTAFAQADATFRTESTSNTPNAQTYRDYLNEAEAELAQLAFLTSDNPKQKASLNALAYELAEIRRNALGALLPPDPAPSPVLQFKDADQQLKNMAFEEESLLATRIQLSEVEYRRMSVFFRTCFSLGALVLFWTFLDILRQSVRANRAEKAVSSLNIQLQNAHDAEAKKIARDLHDSVGQSLAAVKMALSGIEATADLPQGVREKVQFASKGADESIREIRTISYLLHPPMLEELGFAAAAEWFVRSFSERSGIAVNLDLPEDPLKLRPEVALTLFRALQVGLSNVHRHARSASANVLVSRDAADICLDIQDRGVGIDAERLELLQSLPAAAGVGLGGLKERVRQLAGHLAIDSNSSGTSLRVRLPKLDA